MNLVVLDARGEPQIVLDVQPSERVNEAAGS
jgi:hypothetical protein